MIKIQANIRLEAEMAAPRVKQSKGARRKAHQTKVKNASNRMKELHGTHVMDSEGKHLKDWQGTKLKHGDKVHVWTAEGDYFGRARVAGHGGKGRVKLMKSNQYGSITNTTHPRNIEVIK